MELESELRALASEIAWPETPEPSLALVQMRRRRRLRRPLVLTLAALAVALAATLAVPQSRGAILRLLHLRGATIRILDTLPAARERPLAYGLGEPVDAAGARGALGRPPLLPPLPQAPPLHLSPQGVVSVLFQDHGRPVLLSELESGGPSYLKKVAAGGTQVRWTSVEGEPGVWLAGPQHVFVFPGGGTRLAGNTLVWQQGSLTLRLEGPGLTLAHALALAQSVR
jgi:hypothetical protein